MFRILYAKTQLHGIDVLVKILFIILGILSLQYFLSTSNNILVYISSFLLPYMCGYSEIGLKNTHIKLEPNSEYIDQWKLHSAEHLIANRFKGRESYYSFGCSNSVIPIWFIINLILIFFISITLAFIISGLIASEIIAWLYHHQNSWIAKLYEPFMIYIQKQTLLKPDIQHIEMARQTRNKLMELENGL